MQSIKSDVHPRWIVATNDRKREITRARKKAGSPRLTYTFQDDNLHSTFVNVYTHVSFNKIVKRTIKFDIKESSLREQ